MALVERHEGEADMHDESRIQRGGRGQAAPELEKGQTSGFGRVERDQPGGVIGEVARQIREQEQPRSEPEAPSSKLRSDCSRCHETSNRPALACATSSSSMGLRRRSSTHWRGNAFGGTTRLASGLSRATPPTATSTCWYRGGCASPPTR